VYQHLRIQITIHRFLLVRQAVLKATTAVILLVLHLLRAVEVIHPEVAEGVTHPAAAVILPAEVAAVVPHPVVVAEGK